MANRKPPHSASASEGRAQQVCAQSNRLQGSRYRAEYQWGGNWETVKAELRRLRIRLRLAVRARDEFATHGACEAILAWGNVDGAVGFLKEQMHDKNLVNYLRKV
ncbi:hypothetical protein [Pseudomonas syringae]|uniref:hypothetical protein n=1 Tax=Pseudomonas syringae TaxID=317 RepID=UPI001379EB62|nr:hypothetical protein [Pseudomonas syringae]